MLAELYSGQEIKYKQFNLLLISCFTLFYMLWCVFIIDARIDHLLFYLLITILFLYSRNTRKFTLGMVFFILFWILYDGLRVFPNYMFNEVNILEPFEIEKKLFGISHGNTVITLNEYFKLNSNTVLDVITAMFYLTWVPIPLALAIYLFFYNREVLLKFTACYLFTNLIGFVIYYTYPAAPPWYLDQYGNEFRLNVPSSAAELLNFDKLIHYPLFQNIYTKNSNVFAAIPSLHAAYPVVAWFYSRKKVPQWFTWLIFIDILGIWFSAVYSNHHYVIDVILGALVAIFCIILFEKLILKSVFSNFISNFAKLIDNQ